MTTTTIGKDMMPRADLRKKLDDTLAETFMNLDDFKSPQRDRKDDFWHMVHCKACKVDFQRPEVMPNAKWSDTAPTCPRCKVGKLSYGSYPWDKVRVHGPEDENASKRGHSEGRVRLPISEKDEIGAAAAADRERSPRGISVPPRGKIVSIVRSTLSSMIGSANKKVTIDNLSPMRHSPQSSAMADSPASAETEYYPDQNTGKEPEVPILPTASGPPRAVSPTASKTSARGRTPEPRTLTIRKGSKPRTGSASRSSAGGVSLRSSAGVSRSSAASRRTACSVQLQGCCVGFASDKCGNNACRKNICAGCSKPCPLGCPLPNMCPNCFDPSSHHCYAKLIHQVQQESRAAVATVMEQGRRETAEVRRDAEQRLSTLEQMVRESKDAEVRLKSEKEQLQNQATAQIHVIEQRRATDLARGELDAAARADVEKQQLMNQMTQMLQAKDREINDAKRNAVAESQAMMSHREAEHRDAAAAQIKQVEMVEQHQRQALMTRIGALDRSEEMAAQKIQSAEASYEAKLYGVQQQAASFAEQAQSAVSAERDQLLSQYKQAEINSERVGAQARTMEMRAVEEARRQRDDALAQRDLALTAEMHIAQTASTMVQRAAAAAHTATSTSATPATAAGAAPEPVPPPPPPAYQGPGRTLGTGEPQPPSHAGAAMTVPTCSWCGKSAAVQCVSCHRVCCREQHQHPGTSLCLECARTESKPRCHICQQVPVGGCQHCKRPMCFDHQNQKYQCCTYCLQEVMENLQAAEDKKKQERIDAMIAQQELQRAKLRRLREGTDKTGICFGKSKDKCPHGAKCPWTHCNIKADEDKMKREFTDQRKPQPRGSAFSQSGAQGSGTPAGPSPAIPVEEEEEPWDDDYDDDDLYNQYGGFIGEDEKEEEEAPAEEEEAERPRRPRRGDPDGDHDDGGGDDKKKKKKDKKEKKKDKKKKKKRRKGGDGDGSGGSSSTSTSTSNSSTSSSGSRRKRRRNKNDSVDKFDIPRWPNAAGLDFWFEKTCRIISGSTKNYGKAYDWMLEIRDKTKEEDQIMKELQDSGKRFGQVDQKIAADMLKKCHEIKNNSKAEEVHRDAAVQIILDNQSAHSAVVSRMMKGREMIRILMKHLSIRKAFGQHVTVTDLQKIQLTGDKDKKLKAFQQLWDHWYGKFIVDVREFTSDLQEIVHQHYWRQIKDAPCLKQWLTEYLTTPEPLGTSPNCYKWLHDRVDAYLARKRYDAQTENHLKGLVQTHDSAPAGKGKGKGKGKSDSKGKGKGSKGDGGKGKSKGSKGDSKGKGKGKGKGKPAAPAADDPKQKANGSNKRAQTPPPAPVVPAKAGGKYNPRNKCFASSLGLCKFQHDPSKCPFSHEKLNADERKFRDQWMDNQRKANKPIPWEEGRNLTIQNSTKPSVPSAAGGNGKKAEPKKIAKCKAHAKGSCAYGNACRFAHE